MKVITKLSLIAFMSLSLNAGEIQYGKGNFEIKGGFIGLDKSINADLQTYSFLEQHKNFGSSSWFYKYNFTFYDSKQMVQTQSSINSYTNGYFNPPISLTTPSIDYRVQGMDINLVLGKDISRTDENNYLGLGLMIGISLPWIDSKKDDNNDDSTSDNTMNNMTKSKTEIYTYKIGPSITYRKSLNNLFSFYTSATYAYQNGTIKNDYLNSDLSVNGLFQEYDLGFRFQPVSFDKKVGWFTFSPRLYATIGYRYTSWDLKDINIDITGINTNFTKSDFLMKSKITYFGLGYSF